MNDYSGDQNDPREDGYVECTECGHPVERHGSEGCWQIKDCTCTVSWTQREIEDLRQREGLPRRWDHVTI